MAEVTKIKRFPSQVTVNRDLVSEATRQGAVNAKVILTRAITLGNWVRLHCQFGCPYYGKRFTCPTFTPTSEEMSGILLDYNKALVVEAATAEGVHGLVLGLETYFRNLGPHTAFALEALPCNLCPVCTVETYCEHPQEARPTLQACGIDVPGTMLNIGWNAAARHEACTSQQKVGLVLID
ncbi:MAG: DUF2284 domain-containing protein [Nitrospinaceae bacterium]